MNKKNTFSIGEFSEKTGVSIRTLHYYDDIGLLQPEKNPSSGHRIYKYQDIILLQKIISLKILGYSLDKIKDLLHETSFTVELNDSLSLHIQALEKEKEQLERSIQSIQRVSRIVEEEGEVDSAILFSLIHETHMENMHKEWMEQHRLTDVAKEIEKKPVDDKLALDQTFIQLSKNVKQLYGKPVDDPNVQAAVKDYLEASFAFFGEDLMQKLADTEMEEQDIQQLENMAPSPFTEEEQIWLTEAMDYYVKQVEENESR
ncbi:MerR family transcriptional regulator [Alteribacter aurantiacus]|uniref:MerR family transcriptional regulator n=1 Tax=Alteribacter aurantiacus TaxID=254410 RepID=UPI00040E3928|nr:MerR family transcriptional regulator [Alteribacter aurantiacus]